MTTNQFARYYQEVSIVVLIRINQVFNLLFIMIHQIVSMKLETCKRNLNGIKGEIIIVIITLSQYYI